MLIILSFITENNCIIFVRVIKHFLLIKNMGKKVGVTLKIIAAFLAVNVLGLFFSVQINTSTYYNSNFNDHSTFFSETYKNHKEFGDVPLTKIRMLASHDSCSDKLSYLSRINPNQEDHIGNQKWIDYLAKGVAIRLGKAQNDDIYNQLVAGVRFIDLRVTYVDGVFYTCHGYLSEPLEDATKLILKFLDEHPGEFVVYSIMYYYPGNSNWLGLENFLRSVKYNGKCIFDYDRNLDIDESKTTTFKDLTYNNITNNGKDAGTVVCARNYNLIPVKDDDRCIFLNHGHEEDGIRGKTLGFATNSMNSELVCKNTVEFVDYLDKLDESTKKEYFIINETETRPNTSEIWEVYNAWSLLNKAYDHNMYMINQKIIDIDTMIDKMPIYMCDFSTCNENGFNDFIIGKLQEKNNSLTKETIK